MSSEFSIIKSTVHTAVHDLSTRTSKPKPHRITNPITPSQPDILLLLICLCPWSWKATVFDMEIITEMAYDLGIFRSPCRQHYKIPKRTSRTSIYCCQVTLRSFIRFEDRSSSTQPASSQISVEDTVYLSYLRTTQASGLPTTATMVRSSTVAVHQIPLAKKNRHARSDEYNGLFREYAARPYPTIISRASQNMRLALRSLGTTLPFSYEKN